MATKKKPTSSAAEVMHRRYIKGKKKRLKYIEKERERVQIAQQIYELRTNAGLTQGQLAERVGTSQSVISRLEGADYGGHTLRILRHIALALDRQIEVRFTERTHGLALSG